jgi:hypothetical protein
METIIWSCQILLALAFFHSGICKTLFEKTKLISMGQTGVANISIFAMRFIGALELLGAAGIILPWHTNIIAVLTPVTAVCFAIVMILAARVHYKLREPKNVRSNMLLLLLSIAVAYFRFGQLQ